VILSPWLSLLPFPYFPTAEMFELRAHVCDELGSALRHGPKTFRNGATAGATAAMCAVTSPATGEQFSAFWLTRPLKAGDEVTVDRAAPWAALHDAASGRGSGSNNGSGAAAALLRRAVLLALRCPEDGDVAAEEGYFVALHRSAEAVTAEAAAAEAATSESAKASGGLVPDGGDGMLGYRNYPLSPGTAPTRAAPCPAVAAATLGVEHAARSTGSDSGSVRSSSNGVVKVCSDSAWVREQLTSGPLGGSPHPRLQLTDTPAEAHALWMRAHLSRLPQLYGFDPKPAATAQPQHKAPAAATSPPVPFATVGVDIITVSGVVPPAGLSPASSMSHALAALPAGCGFGYGSCQVLNQLPFEACLIRKDHLADTIRLWHAKRGQPPPPWLPRTYDLTHPNEVTCWLGHAIANARRQNYHILSSSNNRDTAGASGVSAKITVDAASAAVGVCAAVDMASGESSDAPSCDVWVVKPAALARSIGTTVTRSPACVVQCLLLGPQVVQAYLTPPLLFKGRKFDCRFNALLRVDAATRKPALFAWSVFWVRVADRPYDAKLQRLDDVTAHLTAMHLLLKPSNTAGDGLAVEQTESDQGGGEGKTPGNNQSSHGAGPPQQSVPNPSCAEFEAFAAVACPGGAVGWQEVKRQVHALMATAFLAAFDRCPAMLGTGSKGSSSADSEDGEGSKSEGERVKGCEEDNEGGGSSSGLARGAAAIYGFDVMFDGAWRPHLLEVQFDPSCKEGFSAAEALGCLLLGEDDGPHLVPLALD